VLKGEFSIGANKGDAVLKLEGKNYYNFITVEEKKDLQKSVSP